MDWRERRVTKAVLHQVVILAGVTTLVFNANPLLRFDGYYILSDALEIPTCPSGPTATWATCAGATCSAPRPSRRSTHRPGARVAGGLCAGLGDLLDHRHGVDHRAGGGAVLRVWGVAGPVAAYGLAVQPLVKFVRFVARDPALEGHRRKAGE